MTNSDRAIIAVTMGDAAGIGPEIILKSLDSYSPQSARTVVVGGYEVFRRAAETVRSPLLLKRIRDVDEGDYQNGTVNILDLEEPDPSLVPYGAISPASARASVLAIRKVYEISQANTVKAIVSAPLNKQAMKEAGFDFGDECDLMAHLTGAPMPMMLLISDKMRMATLSPLHVPLRQACDNITSQRVLRALEVLHASLFSFGLSKPLIGIAALNPHGGEGGTLGDEEIREIVPAVRAAIARGLDVRGPFPADTLFFRASKGEFDAVLAMYHDQGRIAMKTADFGRITIAMIGIPVPFLTVAHGTAYDIAGTGKADPSNFVQVLQLANDITVADHAANPLTDMRAANQGRHGAALTEGKPCQRQSATG